MRRNDASARRGFTLIELLITAAIAAMIALAVGATFAGGLNIYRRVESRGGARTDVLLCLEKIERDIRSMLALSDVTFNGRPKSITFAGLITETDRKGNKNRSLGSITYYLNEKKENLLRKEKNYPQALAEADTGEIARETLVSVKNIDFTYFIYDADLESYEWASSWAPELPPEEEEEGEEEGEEETEDVQTAEESEEEEDKDKIPLGVKIELTYEDRSQDVTLARTMFMPTAVSRHKARLAEEKAEEEEEAEGEESE